MTKLNTLPARRPDWRGRLATYLAGLAGAPFRPGHHDCALFAAGAVEAMTGADLAADYRGTYRTIKAGRDALAAVGYASHVALVADYCPEVPAALAQVGDLAALPGDGGDALGIIQGGAVYVLTPSGLALVNRLHITKAFRV